MPVAPYESCISCYRGDVTTAFGLRGEAEWLIAALIAKVGLPSKEAQGAVLVFAEEEGCDPGMVPPGTMEIAVRLCTTCAAEKNIVVGDVAAGELPGYAQGS